MKITIIIGLLVGNLIAAALGIASIADALERSIFQAAAIFCVAMLERKKQ